MAHSYPIWIEVYGDPYKSSKSYGTRDGVTNNIYVGSSARNSDFFGTVQMRRSYRYFTGTEKYYWLFSLFIDGKRVKTKIYEDDKGKPGECVQTLDMLENLEEIPLRV